MRTRERIAWVLAGVLALVSLANAIRPALAQVTPAQPVESVVGLQFGAAISGDIKGYQMDSTTMCYVSYLHGDVPTLTAALSCVEKVPPATS